MRVLEYPFMEVHVSMLWIRRLAIVSPRPVLTVCACLLTALLFAGCGTATARASATQTPAPTATLVPTVTPTLTPSQKCAAIGSTPGAATAFNFPLPPHTVSETQGGSAGAGFSIECTPGATQASITAYLNQAFPQAGWKKWNPQTDNANGCGTEANDYWQWTNGQVAVGWDFNLMTMPEWHLAECSLAYGR